MSDPVSGGSGGGGDELLARKKEFVEAFFRKGIEFTEELLKENERLRFRVVQLEEQMATAQRSVGPSQATLEELVTRIHMLQQEREQLLQRFEDVARENREYLERFREIERENNNLASLYVAAYQLHSTLELREVLQIVLEILLNFVGAKKLAVMLVDEESGSVRPIATEGVTREEVPAVAVGTGVIGGVAQTGQPHFGPVGKGVSPRTTQPGICVPLRIKDRVVGVVAIWEFLVQKTELVDVDYEIFSLLGAHAATALQAARLAAEAGGDSPYRFAAIAARL